jgi:ABC-type antimicrobial peptide transport system permease subunit
MQATTVADLQARAQTALLRDLGLLLALGALAVALAGVAIVNTITVNISAVTKELTLLRAIGMQQRQARLLLLGQASILIVATLVIGVAGGAALFFPVAQSASTPTLVPLFAFPYQFLLPCAALVIGVTLLIAWLQAHRVTRSDVIHALQHE